MHDHIKQLPPYTQATNQITSPAFLKILTKVFVVILFLILLVLIFAPWQQTARGNGRVIAFSPNDRTQTVNVFVSGRLGTWHVVEGSFVKKGDLIVEILDPDPEYMARLELERDANTKKLEAAELSSESGKKNFERQQSLFEKGISSKRQVELAQIEHSKYLSEEAKARSELAKINTKIARQSNQQVIAPADGYILNRKAGQGTVFVKKGDAVATLVPSTESRAVELWIDGNDMPLVQHGDRVRLQFEGWPAIQFSGWPSVAIGTFGGEVILVDPADNGQGKFRILITPDKNDAAWPDTRYLRQGVRSIGWVLLNEVSVGYELWRIFNGFPPSLNDAPSEKGAKKK